MDALPSEARGSPASRPYYPRDPAQSLLYQAIAANLETFLAWRQQRDRPVPSFVEEESGRSWNAEFWNTVSCGCAVRCAGGIGFWHSPVRAAVFARRVAAGGWPIRRRDVAAVAERVASRVMALMESEAGIETGEDHAPPLAELYSAAIAGRMASGPNAGQRLRTLGQFNPAVGFDDDAFPADGPHCARVSGFSVHAGVGIRAADRKGLEVAVAGLISTTTSTGSHRHPRKPQTIPMVLPLAAF